MQYKGFEAKVRYSASTAGFYGEAVGEEAIIAFQATEVLEVESAFQEAVDRYLCHVYPLDFQKTVRFPKGL